MNVAVFLEKASLYSKDKMTEEGIPFVIRNDTVYLPFMGLLLGKKQRELKPVHQISFLTQRILLQGLYEGYDHDTVSKLAEHLDVSKMAINILEASRLGMEKALEGLKVKPDIIITDYMDLYHTSTSYIKLAHADALCASVAAASILAKVERDRYMVEISKEYPNYGFDKHKGYGTKKHIDAIKKYGVTPIHRKTFKPVSNLLDIQLSFDLDE